MTLKPATAMYSPSGIYLRKNARRKYDAILHAAHRQFLKHGYTHTSMDTIAAGAGVSKQTVYSYFTNKDMLFCQMVESECMRHSPPETLLANPALKPEDALFKIGRGFVDLIISHRGLAIYRLVMAETERHPRIAKLFYDCGPFKIYEGLLHYFNQPKAREAFDIPEPVKAAVNFIALCRAPFHLKMLLKIKPSPTKKEIDEHIRYVVGIFCQLYGRK